MSSPLPKLTSLLLEQNDFRITKKFAFRPGSSSSAHQVSDIEEALGKFVIDYFGVELQPEAITSLAKEIWGEFELKGELH